VLGRHQNVSVTTCFRKESLIFGKGGKLQLHRKGGTAQKNVDGKHRIGNRRSLVSKGKECLQKREKRNLSLTGKEMINEGAGPGMRDPKEIFKKKAEAITIKGRRALRHRKKGLTDGERSNSMRERNDAPKKRRARGPEKNKTVPQGLLGKS